MRASGGRAADGGAGVPPPLPPPLPPRLARDFAAATATADFRHDLVKAMRGWRRVRTSAQLVLWNGSNWCACVCQACAMHSNINAFAGTAAATQRARTHAAHRGPSLQGIRTLVLTNATGQLLAREQEEGLLYNEVWRHYPDHSGISTGKPGDPRAAVTPALARSALGTRFKWLIYGDVSSVVTITNLDAVVG